MPIILRYTGGLKMEVKMPTIVEVEQADREQICRWYRSLDFPTNLNEALVWKRLLERFYGSGGTPEPEISKRIGLRIGL